MAQYTSPDSSDSSDSSGSSDSDEEDDFVEVVSGKTICTIVDEKFQRAQRNGVVVDLTTEEVSESSALYVACQQGNVDAVRKLLRQKWCDVNQKEFDGDSPLSVALRKNHVVVVRLLLTHPDIDRNALSFF